MTTLGRFYNWLTSWSLTSRRKVSTPSSTGPTSSVSLTASVLKGDKLASSNIKKAVRFAEIQDGKVLAQVLNKNERPSVDTTGVRVLDETLEEVYIKDGVIRGFILVKNLEPGRQVLVRYTGDSWKSFKQVKPKRVDRITHSKGKQQIRLVRQRNRNVLRRRKQVKPRDTDTGNRQLRFFLKIEVDRTKLSQVELVVISSLNNVVDTNHQQCYSFKCVRRSWEENVTSHCARDVNGGGNSRQS